MSRLSFLVCLAVAPALALAQPVLLSHHGHLVDGGDVPVEGSRTLTMKLYDSENGGEAVWFESYAVTVSRGRYSVVVGDTKEGKKALDTTDLDGERWLGVAIDGVDLTPHLRLGVVPRAVKANDADALGGVAAAQYARKSETAALAGATFTGPVSLAGAPTLDAHAATKGYVDGEISATRAYVDAEIAAATPEGYAQLSGATFTGPVALAADPTAPLGAATKQYVDALAPRLSAAEGSITTLSTGLTDAVGVNTTQTEKLADLQALVAPLFPRNTAAGAKKDCKAILDAGESKGSGIYFIKPNSATYAVHCDMVTQDGGWTLAMNVHPSDGSNVSFTNTRFWKDEVEYGEIGAHFTNDYKSPAAWELVGTSFMVQVAKPGPLGTMIGWKAWSMPVRSLDSFFDLADNTTVSTAVLGSNVANVYTYEPLVRQGSQLIANRKINPNGDRVRLGASGYTAQSDDNVPGLGTQMNEDSCGVGKNCYRYRDVELWVNSTTNLWATQAQEGSFGWIGRDGGCGAVCDDSEQNKNGQYAQLWTYHLYIR